MSVTLKGALGQFVCIYFWWMTCQHHCQAQCHSAAAATESNHPATDYKKDEKQSLTLSCWFLVIFSFIRSSLFAAVIFIIVPVSGFVLFPMMLGVSKWSICWHCFHLGDQRHPSEQTSWTPNVFLTTSRGLLYHLYCIQGQTFLPACSISPRALPSILSPDTALSCIAWIWAVLKNSNHNMAPLVCFSHHHRGLKDKI